MPLPEPNPANPSRGAGPLWILNRRSGQLWLGARLSDLVRGALNPDYPHHLPGNRKNAVEQLEARKVIAARAEAEVLASPIPHFDPVWVDPSSDGALLRSLRAYLLISYGRL